MNLKFVIAFTVVLMSQSIESVKSSFPEHRPAISFFYLLKRGKNTIVFVVQKHSYMSCVLMVSTS